MKVVIQTGNNGQHVLLVEGKNPEKVAIAYGKVLDIICPRWEVSDGKLKKLKKEGN